MPRCGPAGLRFVTLGTRRKASALRQGRAAQAVKHAAQACLLAAVGAPLGAPLPLAVARERKRQTSGARNCIARTRDFAWLGIRLINPDDCPLRARTHSKTPTQKILHNQGSGWPVCGT